MSSIEPVGFDRIRPTPRVAPVTDRQKREQRGDAEPGEDEERRRRLDDDNEEDDDGRPHVDVVV